MFNHKKLYTSSWNILPCIKCAASFYCFSDISDGMSMHTATNPGMNIEDELEAEIQRELDALEIDENEEENDADYPHLPEDKEEEDEVRGFNSLALGRI